MKNLKGWISLVILLVLTGCATVGQTFSPDNVDRIDRGKTTKNDLYRMFGNPYRRGVEDGDSTWTYLHYKFRLFGDHLKTRDLYVVFDDAGRVKSFTYNSNMGE